jgi:hypothetical protein
MNRASRPRLALVTGLGLFVAAVPPTRAANTDTVVRTTRRSRAVVCAPLFDTYRSFKAGTAVELRFRAREALTGIPIQRKEISFQLRDDETTIPLAATEVKKGVFAVPFTPQGPGQYWLDVSIRGAPADAIPAVRLGVLGLADNVADGPPKDSTA